MKKYLWTGLLAGVMLCFLFQSTATAFSWKTFNEGIGDQTQDLGRVHPRVEWHRCSGVPGLGSHAAQLKRESTGEGVKSRDTIETDHRGHGGVVHPAAKESVLRGSDGICHLEPMEA